MKKLIGLVLLTITNMWAQPQATTSKEIKQALTQKALQIEQSRVASIPFKNIGPSVMNGRVVALAVNPEDPTEFYVAYASGGVWHTQDNGISFTPIMDNSPTQNIGEIMCNVNKSKVEHKKCCCDEVEERLRKAEYQF